MIRKIVDCYEVVIDDDVCKAAVIGKNLYTFKLSSCEKGKILIENSTEFELFSPTLTIKENLIDVLVEICEEIENRSV